MQAIIETVFDVLYLATVIVTGILMIRNARSKKQDTLFGTMALILGLGDSFHLIPRALALCTTGLASYTTALGIGKLTTSITMTVFYVILYFVWRKRYHVSGRHALTVIVYALAAMRIALCMFPGNGWTSPSPELSWSIYRNIPFALLGLLIIWLFYDSAKENVDISFRYMWLTILLSFAFYIPVVLWSDTVPLIGMLMIPKTCAYVWTVMIGYFDMKRVNSIKRKRCF